MLTSNRRQVVSFAYWSKSLVQDAKNTRYVIMSVGHTILDAALKVVDDCSEDGGEVHHMSTLSKTQSEQLIPAGSHQTGICLMTEEERDSSVGWYTDHNTLLACSVTQIDVSLQHGFHML